MAAECTLYVKGCKRENERESGGGGSKKVAFTVFLPARLVELMLSLHNFDLVRESRANSLAKGCEREREGRQRQRYLFLSFLHKPFPIILSSYNVNELRSLCYKQSSFLQKERK